TQPRRAPRAATTRGRSATCGSIALVRQDGKRVELDAFLVQVLRLLRRGLAVDRAVLDLAVVHLARLVWKLAADVLGVLDEMVAHLPELRAQLALLRRDHRDRIRALRRDG